MGDVGDLGDLVEAESEGERGGPRGEETESSLGLLSILIMGKSLMEVEVWEEKEYSIVSEHFRELVLLSEDTAETPELKISILRRSLKGAPESEEKEWFDPE